MKELSTQIVESLLVIHRMIDEINGRLKQLADNIDSLEFRINALENRPTGFELIRG